MAAKNAQDLMRGAVVVMISKHPIAPCRRPVVSLKQVLKPGSGITIWQPHRLSIDDQRQLRIIRKHTVIG